MSDTRQSQQELLERIHRFAVAGESNEVAEDDWSDFEQLLIDNDDACRLYVAYMGVSALLPAVIDGWPDPDSSALDTSAAEHPLAAFLPAFDSVDGSIPGTTSYFSSGWPVAYLIATIVFAAGLAIGAFVHVSQPAHLVLPSPPGGRHELVGAKGEGLSSPIVARITGMVDCVWEGQRLPSPFGREAGGEGGLDSFAATTARLSNQKSEILNHKSLVALGDRLALRSGLLELTYDTGARVILQGPVTYEVESPAGGYLSLGKLTARLEKGSGIYANPKRQRGSEAEGSGNHPSPDLFAIRTPTAIVTDLGTEFGVEVGNEGQAYVSVFLGKVEVVAHRRGTSFGKPRQLAASQAVVISQDDGVEQPLKVINAGDRSAATSFVRSMTVPPMSSRVLCNCYIGSQGWFSVAKDDLINIGESTLARVELVHGKALFNSDVRKLNDGEIYAGRHNNNTEEAFVPSDGAVVVMTLNTAIHPLGYDIRSIMSLTGSEGPRDPQRRSSQIYDVAYARVNNPDEFITLHGDKNATVDRSTLDPKDEEERVTLFGDGSPLIARRVAKLRFTFHNAVPVNLESMYREIDVFGSPSKDKEPE